MPLKKPEILILGAGAVGLSIAGMLSKKCVVSVVCRKKHADAVSKDGLFLSGVWGEETIRDIKCYFRPDELLKINTDSKTKKFDFILITSKSSDTEKICEDYRVFLKGSVVVSIQNGIGNEEIIKKYTEKIIGATITTNFRSLSDGCVKVMSESEPLRLGIYPYESPDNLHYQSETDSLLEIFKSSKIKAEKSKNIRSAIWEKSLLNIAVNPLTGLLSVPVGETLNENLKPLVIGLVNETFSVMSAESIKTKWSDPKEYLEYLFGYLIPSFSDVFTSMQQDMKLKRKTEIDFINGAVVRLGEMHKINTPYNSCICSLVRYQEEKYSLSQRTPE